MSRAKLISLNCGTQLTLKANATLVLDGDLCMLVDPGAFMDINEIDASLNTHCGLNVSDLNTIYYTHLHFDHYRQYPWGDNIKKIYIPINEYQYISQLMALRNNEKEYTAYIEKTHDVISPVFLRQFLKIAHEDRYRVEDLLKLGQIELISEDTNISDNIITIGLDGHCAGQLGLKILTQEGTAIIAGDAALSLEDYCSNNCDHHLIMFDQHRWQLSKNKLCEADYVIPGHGPWFDPHKKSQFQPIEG